MFKLKRAILAFALLLAACGEQNKTYSSMTFAERDAAYRANHAAAGEYIQAFQSCFSAAFKSADWSLSPGLETNDYIVRTASEAYIKMTQCEAAQGKRWQGEYASQCAALINQAHSNAREVYSIAPEAFIVASTNLGLQDRRHIAQMFDPYLGNLNDLYTSLFEFVIDRKCLSSIGSQVRPGTSAPPIGDERDVVPPSNESEQPGQGTARPTDGLIVEPARGSADRTAIMNALRPRAVRDLGGDIEFVVLELRAANSLAFASVQPQRPGGGAIDCLQTNCPRGSRMDAILYRENGEWQVVDAMIGADEGWRLRYCPQTPVGLVRGCD